MATTVKHPDRLAEQINNILANPDSWRQAAYHTACGTKHSIAGHGQIASGKSMDDDTCRADAREWYGLTARDAVWLFRHERTLPEIHGFASAALAGEAYFDTNGFDSYGFDRNGFSQKGFNRKGYGRNGYNRAGYRRSGYHRNGCSPDVAEIFRYDVNGYDINGYDLDGYDCNCLDRNGDGLPIL